MSCDCILKIFTLCTDLVTSWRTGGFHGKVKKFGGACGPNEGSQYSHKVLLKSTADLELRSENRHLKWQKQFMLKVISSTWTSEKVILFKPLFLSNVEYGRILLGSENIFFVSWESGHWYYSYPIQKNAVWIWVCSTFLGRRGERITVVLQASQNTKR